MAKNKVATVGFKITAEGAQEYVKTVNQMETSQKKSAASFKLQNEEMKKTETQSEKLARKHQFLTSQIATQSDKVKAMKKAYEEESKTRSLSVAEVEKYEKKINSAEYALAKYKNELKDVEKAEKDYSKGLGQLGTKLTDNAEKIKNVGKTMTVIGGTAAGALTGAYAISQNLNKSWNTIAKSTGAVGDELKELKETAKDVYGSVASDSDDVATAVGDLNTRFGFTGSVLKDASVNFLRFAKVNELDVSSAIQLVSRAMGDASIPAEEYMSVLDTLTVASQNTGISMDVLTTNLAKYGAPMRALGFEVKESIALFSTWEKAGVNTEIAFSGMKKAISNWSAAGKDAKVEFKSMLEQIKNAPNIAAATTMAIETFGAKAGPDLADAIRGGRFEFESLLDTLAGADGQLAATGSEISTPMGKLTIATHNMELAMAEFGDVIAEVVAPIISDLVPIIQGVVKWIKELSPEAKGLIVAIVGIVAALLPLGVIMMGLMPIITGIGAAIGFLTSPIGLAILAIAAIVLAVTVFRDDILGIFTGLKDGIYQVFGPFADLIYGVLVKPFEDWFNAVIKVFDNLIAFVNNVLAGNWEDAWYNIVQIFGGLFDMLFAFVKVPFNAIIGLINLAIDGINTLLRTIDIPDWVPFVGGFKFPTVPHIPLLATGGILTKATLNIAGERGAEAVVPMTNGGVQQELANWILSGMEKIGANIGGNQPIQVVVNLDGKEIIKYLLDDVNKQQTNELQVQMRGFNYGRK
ncbi:phage tail tape measure protein [Culicoidibacter larvae]|uniref:Phage tail tape measure protein n=1 Tax=Culicoidibacter larvae TaxID=2579976 RepID=A0A5R8Q9E5_9FIRM|nr:phage tail tape measure protein [Culicoidibacter larvae]TLG72047.1 phage tail tape measure protein [Culicoidibacter larvae]